MKSTNNYQQLTKITETLAHQYGIPQGLSKALFKQGSLSVSSDSKPVFNKKPLVGQNTNDPAFWLGTGEEVKRGIITNNPIEAISAFLVEQNNQQSQPTLYLSIDSVLELPSNFLSQLDEVIFSVKDEQLANKIKQKLPLAKNISQEMPSWNQLWQQLNQEANNLNSYSIKPKSFQRQKSKQIQL
jgi:hypothetical protein